MKNILIIILLFVSIGCSVQRSLSEKYVGKGVETLYADFGEPKRLNNLENGHKLFIYEKETLVRETVIGTGEMTLDQRMSPAFIKVEVFQFEIDNHGIIVKTIYEKKID
jgi:hypothetical protein